MDYNKTYSENRSIIKDLKKIINKSLIGKSVEIKYNSKIFRGIIINETKNTIVIEPKQSKEEEEQNNQTLKSFIKSSIKIKTKETTNFIPAKYLGDPILRIRHKIIFKDNQLL